MGIVDSGKKFKKRKPRSTESWEPEIKHEELAVPDTKEPVAPVSSKIPESHKVPDSQFEGKDEFIVKINKKTSYKSPVLPKGFLKIIN